MLQQIGFGLTRELVGVVVRDYLKDQEIPFEMVFPVNDWWRLLRRNSVFVNHNTCPLFLASAEVLDSWFSHVKDVFSATSLPTEEF